MVQNCSNHSRIFPPISIWIVYFPTQKANGNQINALWKSSWMSVAPSIKVAMQNEVKNNECVVYSKVLLTPGVRYNFLFTWISPSRTSCAIRLPFFMRPQFILFYIYSKHALPCCVLCWEKSVWMSSTRTGVQSPPLPFPSATLQSSQMWMVREPQLDINDNRVHSISHLRWLLARYNSRFEWLLSVICYIYK